jgi:NAD(P)-dependent dehydrogenase (short-subunit alcohol dehydrogenase family)
VLVNNAAEQHPQDSIERITPRQLERTFRTNVFGMFYLTQAALPHLGDGSAIVNTTSVTAYRGSPTLLDYASTKGAIVAFTRSLAESLADKHIRVNAVAPGPVWTPLIPSAFPPERVATFGSDVPMKRAGEDLAEEIAGVKQVHNRLRVQPAPESPHAAASEGAGLASSGSHKGSR